MSEYEVRFSKNERTEIRIPVDSVMQAEAVRVIYASSDETFVTPPTILRNGEPFDLDLDDAALDADEAWRIAGNLFVTVPRRDEVPS